MPKGKRRLQLERWFNDGVQRLHCIAWDADTGQRWAELLARLRNAARAVPLKDSLIAATALLHGLTVVTQNVSDFEPTGVEIVNPFAEP